VNKDVPSKFESLSNGYLHLHHPLMHGLPSITYCAGQLNVSAKYFGNLTKKETGKSAQEYTHLKID